MQIAANRTTGTAARAVLAGTALALAATVLALLAPAGAAAASPTGNTTLFIAKGKQRLLHKRGLALTAVRGAQSAGREQRLQIVDGEIGPTSASFSFSGALRLTAGKGRAWRKVLLRNIRVGLGPRAVLSATLGRRRLAIFDLRAPAERLALNPTAGTAQLLGARLVWKRGAAAVLGRRLGVRIPRGRLGTAETRAATLLDETPSSAPIDSEPPLLARPATAVDVSAPALAWHVRDSWVRYVGSEVADPIDGAAPRAPYPGDQHPCPDNPVATNPTLTYSYDIPFAHGWYDPPSGAAALYYSGGVHFAYPSRGIDLSLTNPEIEINGASSRAIFRLRGSGATAYPDKRAAIMSLDAGRPLLQAPPGTYSSDGVVRATLTEDGQKVFGGFYTGTNSGFGCFAFSFTAA